MSWSVSSPSSKTNTSPCSVGFIVPASTLRYGSIFMTVTRKPFDCKMFPIEAVVVPFPTPLITPPTTKMYFGFMDILYELRIRFALQIYELRIFLDSHIRKAFYENKGDKLTPIQNYQNAGKRIISLPLRLQESV